MIVSEVRPKWKNLVESILMHESKPSSLQKTHRVPKYGGSNRKDNIMSDEKKLQRQCRRGATAQRDINQVYKEYP